MKYLYLQEHEGCRKVLSLDNIILVSELVVASDGHGKKYYGVSITYHNGCTITLDWRETNLFWKAFNGLQRKGQTGIDRDKQRRRGHARDQDPVKLGNQ